MIAIDLLTERLYLIYENLLLKTILIFFLCLYQHESFAYKSSKECEKCHKIIYNEWKNTTHANAWEDSVYKKATKNYTKDKCLPCHASKPILETGLKNQPVLRDNHRSEGVSCITCHTKGIKQMGTLKGARGECNPSFSKDVLTGAICMPCHKIEAAEWRESSYFRKNINCLNCHMEKVHGELASGKLGEYGEHKWPGGTSPLYLESVVKNLLLTEDKSILTVRFKPFNVGHNFPTGNSGSPSFHILIKIRNGSGKLLKTFRKNFVRTRDEKKKDTTIGVDELFEFKFKLPISKGLVEFLAFYKKHSRIKDHDAIILRNQLYEFM